MASCYNSGHFIRNKETGQFGVTGLDPYGMCGSNEVAITFCTNPNDSNKWLGDGFPFSEWEIITRDQVSAEVRTQYAHFNPI